MSDKRLIYIIVGLFLLLTSTVIISGDIATANQKDIYIMGVMCIITLFYIYYSWHVCQGTFMNGYIIFITAFYAFNLGQPILRVFNWVDPKYELLNGIHVATLNANMYLQSTYVGLVSIVFMHIGALLALSNKRHDMRVVSNAISIQKKLKAIAKVSFAFLLISFPFWLYETSQLIMFSAIYGYGGELIDVKASIPGYVRLLSDYFEPSLLCLYFCSEYFKRDRIVVLGAIFFTVILPPIIIGGRSQAVIALAMISIIYSLFHRVKIKKLIIYGVCVYLLFFVLFIVKASRKTTSNTLDTYSEILSESETSPISSVLSEMGHSMYPLGATMEIVPSKEDYRYGSTYLWGLSTIIPNLGFWDVHPSTAHANLGHWLMEKKGLSYGPGYSLTAEAYINFGYFGFVFFLLFGYLLAKYCKYINTKYLFEKPFFIIVTLVFLWFSIKTVRNSFLGIVRAFFYVSVPFYLLFNYEYKKLAKR